MLLVNKCKDVKKYCNKTSSREDTKVLSMEELVFIKDTLPRLFVSCQ